MALHQRQRSNSITAVHIYAPPWRCSKYGGSIEPRDDRAVAAHGCWYRFRRFDRMAGSYSSGRTFSTVFAGKDETEVHAKVACCRCIFHKIPSRGLKLSSTHSYDLPSPTGKSVVSNIDFPVPIYVDTSLLVPCSAHAFPNTYLPKQAVYSSFIPYHVATKISPTVPAQVNNNCTLLRIALDTRASVGL